jgi:hypothetical protein
MADIGGLKQGGNDEHGAMTVFVRGVRADGDREDLL